LAGDILLKQLGEELRRLRKFRKLSQEEVAERAELHPTYYGQVERGEVNPSIKTVLQIVAAIEIDPAQLINSVLKIKKSEKDSLLNEILIMLKGASTKQLMLIRSLVADTVEWSRKSK